MADKLQRKNDKDTKNFKKRQLYPLKSNLNRLEKLIIVYKYPNFMFKYHIFHPKKKKK